ncbi:alpha/beta hydrolase fold domain-containing protein [Arthrobacter sp. CAN_C5]|uniref:alpha/beta hydrolase fold domain-containing protein n=1 Tax=Arthrobacter sp. CAN_C5 TaxID=2760706 RepID=UPI001AE852EF|nr:alpha/beta hydrolase fold domain-containing protein [Arthrobacter sp. CAN_C5]MBP2215582.1 acetyl esterase/lipase [Arthrobacter sp. CAN_C5]
MTPTNRTTPDRPSMPLRFASAALRLTPTKGHYNSVDWMRGQYLQRTYPSPASLTRALRRLCSVEDYLLDGVRTVTLRPRSGGSGRHIIYTHGGTYINELTTPHWWIIAALIRSTGATVTVPLYRLAPEHTFAEAYCYLTAVYERVLETTASDDVCLAGDSAGAGLAVGQALHFAAVDLPRPGQLVLFSPWLDVTGTNPDIPQYDRVDPMLGVPGAVEAGRWWAGEADPRHPSVSPVFAPPTALAELPPTSIYQGTRDICMADALAFQRKMIDAGGDVVLHRFAGAFHVFVGLPWLRESRAVFADIAETMQAKRSLGEEKPQP